MRARTIAILIALVVVTVLLFSSASVVSAAGQGRDRNRQLSTKERLTADDASYLEGLPREDRRQILVARGWQEIIIPDEYESYRDLVPIEELTMAYEKALRISGSEVARNDVLAQPSQMMSLDETVKAIEQNCKGKDGHVPFNEFKAEERWVPSANDLRRNHDVLGGWGTSPGDGNTCDFDQSVNGDIVLVKGSGLFPGIFCHAAIVKYRASSSLFSIGPDGDNGVWWNSRLRLHQYSHASVQRVNTWPLSSNRRQDAADYARNQLGKPYNWIFINKWRTDAFYCSQLCWAAYYHPSPLYYKLDVDGVLDTLDYGAVAPDALWASWRTSTVTCSD